MSLVRGPFELKWGDNVLADVESIDITHEVDSEDYETIQGKTYTIDGAFKVNVVITLLASDIAALAAVLPQHFVANGAVMSTGETVSNADGAIDVVAASCTTSTVKNPLDIISCGNPGLVLRVVDARTRLDGVEIDNKVQKVRVMFIGEAPGDEATIQFFKENSIHVVS